MAGMDHWIIWLKSYNLVCNKFKPPGSRSYLPFVLLPFKVKIHVEFPKIIQLLMKITE